MNDKAIITVELVDKDEERTAWLVLNGQRRFLARMVAPPRQSATNEMFLTLCTTMVREMLKEIAPEAMVDLYLQILPKSGHG